MVLWISTLQSMMEVYQKLLLPILMDKGNDAGASPRLNHKDALATIRGGRIPPPESMPSFEEVKEVLGFNSYYEVVYSVFKGQLKMQNQKNQSPQDPIVEVITPEVYNNYGADDFKDSFFGTQLELQKESKKLLKGLFILVLGSL